MRSSFYHSPERLWGVEWGTMKNTMILFLLIASSLWASYQIPEAIILPKEEAAKRVNAWQEANPKAAWAVSTMTTLPQFGSGLSMRPYIQAGDKLLWEPYTGQSLKGKVVNMLVEWCGIPVAHYCYDEHAKEIFTLGTANRHSDGWQPKFKPDGQPRVRGVLVAVIRPKA